MNIPLKRYWDLLVNYLKPQWPKVLLLAVLLFSGIGLQLIIPQILRYFIDAARAGSALQNLMMAALSFLGVAVVKYMLNIATSYVGEDVGWTATNALRADLALHCLRLDMSFHNSHTPGELIERVDGDVQILSNFFSRFVIQVLGNVLLLIGIPIVLFFEDWRVGLALTAFAVITLVVLYNVRDIATPHWKEARQASADLFGFLEERLSGTEDIRSNGAVSYAMQRLYELMRQLFQKDVKAWAKNATLENTTITLTTLGTMLALGLGAYLLMKGAVTIGTVFLIYNYSMILRLPLFRITQEVQNLQQAGAAISRVEELYRTQSRVQDGAGASLPLDTPAVEFQDVSFGYNQDNPVLQDISFQLTPRKTLGLLGRTGSGKTTITRLLFRLYDPTTGLIRLGDVDIRAARLSDLRRRVGMVTQEVQLFNATVRDNLTFFDQSISDKEILKVIRELGLWEWYSSLPEGLDTELESGGSGLSAGEAQLLAFARVFLRDPVLVILDEASSRLDPATERLIERAVERLLYNRTGIVIAHRLETVGQVDEIMILEDGRIYEHGERERLESDPASRFYSLLRTGMEEVLV
jgi:ABC-type multidrug transport system fused ATPase/permease subunit